MRGPLPAVQCKLVETAVANSLKSYEYSIFLLTDIQKRTNIQNFIFLENFILWSLALLSECRKPDQYNPEVSLHTEPFWFFIAHLQSAVYQLTT